MPNDASSCIPEVVVDLQITDRMNAEYLMEINSFAQWCEANVFSKIEPQ